MKSIYVIIDVLDECSLSDCRHFVRYFLELLLISNSRIKMFFTSRVFIEVEVNDILADASVIKIMKTKTAVDMRRFIDIETQKLEENKRSLSQRTI